MTKPKLSSCGNPIIPKGIGEAPVKAYISAMPGWKKDVGKFLDKAAVETIPGVEKAVKWNTPFYGYEETGWFFAFYCFKKYIKVTFFQGESLKPQPPENSKQKNVRYFHIFEEDELDEKKIKKWIKQASKLPGEKL